MIDEEDEQWERFDYNEDDGYEEDDDNVAGDFLVEVVGYILLGILFGSLLVMACTGK